MRSTATWRLNTASNVIEMMSNGRKVAMGSAASEAVAIDSAPQPTMPATNTQIRAVPRERTSVAQGLELFECTRTSCSLDASGSTILWSSADTLNYGKSVNDGHFYITVPGARIALSCMRLSARMPLIVMKKTGFWIGTLVLAGVLGAGAVPAEAAAAKKKTAKTTTQARRLYASNTSLNRRASSARARAVALAREMAVTPLPRYKMDASGDMVPDLRAAAAIMYDPETNQILWEENSASQRSIASITKMMTARRVHGRQPRSFDAVTVARSDVFQASTTHLKMNDRVTTDDLLHLLLIASDNAAARALARVSPLGYDGFIARMNEKAAELGLETTHYADPSGLLSENVSSAYDMARLITYVSQDDRIASIMRTSEYTVTTGRRPITFHSTNHLLGRSDVEVRAGKTGFISKSGYCLATLLRLPESAQQVAVVVLGARSNAGRFMETQNLFNWMSTKAAAAVFATQRTHRPGDPVRKFKVQSSRSTDHAVTIEVEATRSRAALPRRRAAASRWCRRRPGLAVRRFARRRL